MTGASPRGVVLTPEQRRRQRARNVAVALGLVAFMVLLYVVTVVRMGAGPTGGAG